MTPINDFLSKLKRMVVEPKFYAMLVTSPRGQILHIGIHFSLEEAYTAARAKMEEFTPHKKGEPIDIELWNTMSARQALAQIIESSEIDAKKMRKDDKPVPPSVVDSSRFPEQTMFEEFSADPATFIERLSGSMGGSIDGIRVKRAPKQKSHTTKESISDVRKRKNDLMKKLIDDGDVAQVDKLKDILDANAQRYILEAIKNKKDNTKKQ